jgi:adenylate cyclase
MAHIMMAVVYGLSGREEEARAEAPEILRINPKFSLEKMAKSLTYRGKGDCERFLDALRKAGLK